MSIWDLSQTNTYSWQSSQTCGLGQFDDSVDTPTNKLATFFGQGEFVNAVVTSTATEVTATIKYSPQVKQGFVRDREVPGDYTVMFRAVRRQPR